MQAGIRIGHDQLLCFGQEFRPIAVHAALLYFLIAEFSVVNCMYQARAICLLSGAT